MTLSIEIRGTKPDKQAVFIKATHKGEVCRIRTNVTIPKSAFTNVQRHNIMAGFNGSKILNATINDKFDEVQKYVDLYNYKHSELPSIEKLCARFNKPVTKQLSLTDHFKAFLNTKKKFSTERYNAYNSMFDRLVKYNPHIIAETLNLAAANQFAEHLEDLNLNENTISGQMSMLKAFIGYLIDSGINPMKRTELAQIDTTWHERDIIYHPQHEITQLFNAKLSDLQHHARNLYLLQCMIGTRHSDTDSNRWVIQGEFIKLVPKKTESTTAVEVKIHLRPEVMDILNQYPDFKLPTFSNGDYNLLIREVGRLAGINTKVKLLKGRKGYKAGEVVVKHELMSSHVARATFICLMLNNGVSETIVCKMAGIGHAALKHYAHIADETVKTASEQVYALTGNLQTHLKFA